MRTLTTQLRFVSASGVCFWTRKVDTNWWAADA